MEQTAAELAKAHWNETPLFLEERNATASTPGYMK